MSTQDQAHRFDRAFLCIIAVVLVAGLGAGIYYFRHAWKNGGDQTESSVAGRSKEGSQPEFLELTPAAMKAMKLKTSVAKVPRFSRVLHLRGSLAIDSNRLSHVHARFPGQIVELATLKGLQSQRTDSQSPPARPLQNFDVVEQGTPMAVLWSKDLGEIKTQLADALATLRTDRVTLEKYQTLTREGGLSDREYREQKLKVEQGVIAAFGFETKLRAFQVPEAEITQVKLAAEKIHLIKETDTGYSVKDYSGDWPQVIVTAPISGVIVDKAVTKGEIVDANANLFKIADLSVLAVWLHPYEEDLPALEELPKPLQVYIKIPAHPELGEIQADVDRFSPMIDPNEHMALLIGTVKNPDGALLSGQFITAEVGLPSDKGVVEIPTKGVIDFGHEAIVFVQPDSSKPQFHRRRVSIVQRYFDVVHVRSELSSEQKENGLQEIHVGEAVIAGGILELEDHLKEQH